MKMIQKTEKTNTVRSLVKKPEVEKRFKQLLGTRAPQFITSLISVADSLPAGTDPNSILAAAAVSASLDLAVHPSIGQSWIVPYGKNATFQLGYKGLVQLAHRSGQYRFLNTCTVYEGELIKHDKLTSEVVIDCKERISNDVLGYAAFMQLNNGFKHAIYWTKNEVEGHAVRFSQAFKSKNSPWQSDFDSMAQKTVLKQLISKWGPTSIEMQKALTADGAVIDEDDQVTAYPDNPSNELEEDDGDLGPVKETEAEVVA